MGLAVQTRGLAREIARVRRIVARNEELTRARNREIVRSCWTLIWDYYLRPHDAPARPAPAVCGEVGPLGRDNGRSEENAPHER